MADGAPSSFTIVTADLDSPLHLLGYQFDLLSADLVSGRLEVTDKCCQPFKVLHGGVSVVIAEATASLGAQIASGFKRVAGIQVSINHLKAAMVGDVVVSEARPIFVGKSVQVWEVELWRTRPGEETKRVLISSARVVLRAGLPADDDQRRALLTLKKYSKL